MPHPKQLSILLLALALCAVGAQAQDPDTGEFCFTWEWPTQTVDGQDADVVDGAAKIYFAIHPEGAEEQRQVLVENTAITAHCFEDVPAGELQFRHRAYDGIDCAGELSEITTHEVVATRPVLEAPVVQIEVTGTAPATPSEDCDDDPNCERRQ